MEVEAKLNKIAEEKFEDVKLESEMPEISGTVCERDDLKRNSLSKFFRFKGSKSASVENVSGGDAAVASVPKSSTLMRMFKKKDKSKEETEGAEKKKSRRPTLSMRNLVGSLPIVPWIGTKTSQMNLQKPVEITPQEDDDIATTEIATSSQIF
jgi:hypothetical protein